MALPATLMLGAALHGGAEQGQPKPIPKTGDLLLGPLVAVGGGGTTVLIQEEIKKLVGKDSFDVLILPQASSQEGRGLASVEMWEKAGANRVLNLDPLDRKAAVKELARADLLWLPGGSQSRLAQELADADLIKVIQERSRAGLVVAGTSAGAAVMSEVMISGAPDPSPHVSGAMKPLRGLGLWKPVIIDQHFTQRGRQGRLMTAVLDQPSLIGIGIDERTAIVVKGQVFRVVGEGNVSVYDVRTAQRGGFKRGQRQSVIDARVSLLHAGLEFNWR